MAGKPDTSLQSFFRVTIMVGTAVVAGMALLVYGPPPEKVGPIFDRVVTYLSKASESVRNYAAGEPVATVDPQPQVQSTNRAPQAPPAPSFASTSAPISEPPASAGWPRSPAGTSRPHRSASIAAVVSLDPSLELIVSQLESMGVKQLQLVAWGADGQLVRCSGTAPVVGSAFRRMIDSIEANPRDALASMRNQLQTVDAIAQAY